MKTVFIHPERCIGCKQCEVACAVAHSQAKNLFLAVFESPPSKPRIHAEPGLVLNTAFPSKCRHCNPAPCQMACPTAAIFRPVDYPEIVYLNPQKCIACGMCAIVCPFDVITYYASSSAPGRTAVAIKCDHCLDRQRLGETPACVDSCKVGALEWGELNELVKSARTRYSEAVSVAVGRVTEGLMPVPANIEAWQAYGAEVSHLNTNNGKGA
ncbi:MAG TPA: 4Fe-4S dicluster domain-containing protein [Anaerolineales bacterium]